MSDLKDLYQEVILDHNKSPRNFHELAEATAHAEGRNPLCGDQIKIYVNVADDRIKDVSFVGSGCAIATASASLLTEAVKGQRLSDVRKMGEKFRGLMLSRVDESDAWEKIGKLAVFEGVKNYPMRVKCATLAWHTLQAALDRPDSVISTEDDRDLAHDAARSS